MRRNARSLAVACILLALSAGLYFSSLLFDALGASAGGSTLIPPALVSGAARLDLSAPRSSERLTLEKAGAAWSVLVAGQRFPADQARTERLLAALGRRAAYPAVSSAQSSLPSLGLGPDAEGRLAVYGGDGKLLLDLRVGDSLSDGTGSYFRFASEHGAFSGPAELAAFFEADSRSWLDRRVFPRRPDPSQVQRISLRISSGGSGWVLSRGDGGLWRSEGKAAPVDTRKVDAFLRGLGDLELEAYRAARGGPELRPEAGITLRLEFGDGSSASLYARADPEGGFLAALDSAPFLFTLSQASAGRAFPALPYFASAP